MSRDAGQELVQCLGAAADSNVRGAIQNQLSQIRGYLQEAEYLAGTEQKRATMDNAVLELVSMLDDSDPKSRTAALDGLASFGAKEHLPRIIRMLNDESNQVQRAAKKAVLVLQSGISSLDEGDE
jgi:HEAT repeat protein